MHCSTPTQQSQPLCRRLLLTSTAGVCAALLLLAGMFWFSELASPAVVPGPNASGMCGAAPVDTCFACLQKVSCKCPCTCIADLCTTVQWQPAFVCFPSAVLQLAGAHSNPVTSFRMHDEYLQTQHPSRFHAVRLTELEACDPTISGSLYVTNSKQTFLWSSWCWNM